MIAFIQYILCLLADGLSQLYLYLRQFFRRTDFNPKEKSSDKYFACIYVHGLYGFKQQFSLWHEQVAQQCDPYASDVVFDLDKDVAALKLLCDEVASRNYNKIFLVGHSRGCVVIAKLLAQNKKYSTDRKYCFVEAAPVSKQANLVQMHIAIQNDRQWLNTWLIDPIIKLLGLWPTLHEFKKLGDQEVHGHKLVARNDVIGVKQVGIKAQYFSVTHMEVLCSPQTTEYFANIVSSRQKY